MKGLYIVAAVLVALTVLNSAATVTLLVLHFRSDSVPKEIPASDLDPERIILRSGNVEIELLRGSPDWNVILLENNVRFFNVGVAELEPDEVEIPSGTASVVYKFNSPVKVLFAGGVPPYEEEIRVDVSEFEFFLGKGMSQIILARTTDGDRYFHGNDSIDLLEEVERLTGN